MKKYFLPLTLLLFVISTDVNAGTVTIADAQNVALNFIKVNSPALNGAALAATLKYTKAEANGAVDFYVFEISPSPGFVIVAADDNVIPILGYSTESNFNTNFSHIGLSNWMHKTAVNISRALQNNAMADARIQGQWSAYRQGINPSVQRSGAVSPLCLTRWDQEMDTTTNPPPYLYNLYCPFNNTDNQRCLTGCVATAMAQVMKYWNYPAQGVGSFSYTDNTSNGYSNNYGRLSSDFATHTYQWSSMPTQLLDSTSYAEDSAIGLLMYDCAVSVGMDFGDDNQDGSGANALIAEEVVFGDSFCSQYAFAKYFGYIADTMQGVFESSYSPSSWTALIEHELNVGRPVIYEGDDPSQGGHAWVCDGYDASNNLHMNWGWGGFENGYFAINNLTTSGNFNPIDSDDALIGILPKSAVNGITTVNEVISFTMFPNPASHEVVLQASGISNDATWYLKNIVGQTLMSGNMQAAQTRISIGNLADGVYLVELRQGERSIVKRLVVSK